jgi:hypothetical protein
MSALHRLISYGTTGEGCANWNSSDCYRKKLTPAFHNSEGYGKGMEAGE